MEDVGQESLNKLPPDTTANFANEPAVETIKERRKRTDSAALMDATLEISMRDVVGSASEEAASIGEQEGVLTKKDPEDSVVAANDKLARLKLDSSSDNGSEQINEFASLEVNTSGKKKVPNEPCGESPKEESKSGRFRTDTEIISVLFILIYDCAGLVNDFITVEQASKGIKQQLLRLKEGMLSG